MQGNDTHSSFCKISFARSLSLFYSTTKYRFFRGSLPHYWWEREGFGWLRPIARQNRCPSSKISIPSCCFYKEKCKSSSPFLPSTLPSKVQRSWFCHSHPSTGSRSRDSSASSPRRYARSFEWSTSIWLRKNSLGFNEIWFCTVFGSNILRSVWSTQKQRVKKRRPLFP